MAAQLIEKVNWLMGPHKKAHTAAKLITQPRGATLLKEDQRKLCTSYKSMNYAPMQHPVIICNKYSYCCWIFWYSALKTFCNKRLQKMRELGCDAGSGSLEDPTSNRQPGTPWWVPLKSRLGVTEANLNQHNSHLVQIWFAQTWQILRNFEMQSRYR